MAQNISILSFIFFALILIFSQPFESIEGRYLNSNEGKIKVHINEDVVYSGISISNVATLTNMSPPSVVVNGATGGGDLSPPPLVRDVDDFRPTTPGHSPGIGHSIHN